MKLVCLLGFCLLLFGCGGGTSENPRREISAPSSAGPTLNPGSGPAVAPDPNDDRPLIVAFGDSLTAGHGVDPGLSYPDFLRKKLEARGHDWRVVNAGISGETTTGGLNRVSTVTALKPDIVVLELGGNDGLRGMPLDRTRDNLDRIIQELRKAGARIVLVGMTLPPNYGPEYIRRFENIYKELAAKHNLPLVPFLLEGVLKDPAKFILRDGIHATPAGNELAAENVMAILEPLLK
ncbi:MAG: arylesterase [Bryobacteraceae bacterium]